MHDSPLFSRKILTADKNYTQMLGATNHTCVKIIVLGNTHTHSSLLLQAQTAADTQKPLNKQTEKQKNKRHRIHQE